MKFDIKKRFTGEVLFTAEIECDEDASASVKLGLAVKVAVNARADLTGAYLAGAYLACAKNLNLAGSLKIDPSEIPAIPNIDATILAAVEASQAAGNDGLDMGSWHSCATTHCRAGWAIHLAGDKGRALEEKHGPFIAGCLIYSASRPGQAPPHFFASTDAALADLRECAKAEGSSS